MTAIVFLVSPPRIGERAERSQKKLSTSEKRPSIDRVSQETVKKMRILLFPLLDASSLG